jgi:hypothetical protein
LASNSDSDAARLWVAKSAVVIAMRADFMSGLPSSLIPFVFSSVTSKQQATPMPTTDNLAGQIKRYNFGMLLKAIAEVRESVHRPGKKIKPIARIKIRQTETKINHYRFIFGRNHFQSLLSDVRL